MKTRTSNQELDRRHPPAAGTQRSFRFPEFRHFSTGTGLEVLALERPGSPLVTLQYGHRGGSQFDTAAGRGLSSFTAALVDEGTRRRSATELNEAVEGRGGFLGAGSSWDGSFVALTVLSDHTAFAVELLGEIVCEPAFDTEEIDRWRALRLSEIDRRTVDPAALASETFGRAVYGDGVYAGPMIGLRPSIEGMTRSDLAGFWQRHSQAQGSFFVATGGFDVDDLGQILEQGFTLLGQAEPTPLPEIEVEDLEEMRVHIADLPSAAQTELRIGHPGVPRTHPDRPALVLLNSLLGGKFTSRINLNLRERHGYTYGASTQFVDRRCRGPFIAAAAVETASAGAAAEEILKELHRIRDEAPSHQELEETRSYVLGLFPYSLQTLQGLADRLEQVAVYQLSDDYYARLPEQLEAVTVADVQAAARRHLVPDRVAIVAVGPAKELAKQLEGFGPVEVHQTGKKTR